MKGIVLAGGAGTRLYPLTQVASKQLQPVYDKPMIYYPLATLMLGGIRDILLISTPHDLPRFESLLGDGSQWGIRLRYQVQERPAGIAQAFILGASFIANEPVALILGDNVFHGNLRIREIVDQFTRGALIFGYYVTDPERYGVVEFDAAGQVVSIEEKPKQPKSHYAVPGLYLYDRQVCAMAKALKPSARGELEITDLNLAYLSAGTLRVQRLGRGIAWLDTGTHHSLLEASNFIHTLQERQGLRIACLEEIALHMKYIDRQQMEALVARMPQSDYRQYLQQRVLDLLHLDGG
jgi:glucose-1-phosphate thymidylyltransferase